MAQALRVGETTQHVIHRLLGGPQGLGVNHSPSLRVVHSSSYLLVKQYLGHLEQKSATFRFDDKGKVQSWSLWDQKLERSFTPHPTLGEDFDHQTIMQNIRIGETSNS